jgi:hypothetical protein
MRRQSDAKVDVEVPGAVKHNNWMDRAGDCCLPVRHSVVASGDLEASFADVQGRRLKSSLSSAFIVVSRAVAFGVARKVPCRGGLSGLPRWMLPEMEFFPRRRCCYPSLIYLIWRTSQPAAAPVPRRRPHDRSGPFLLSRRHQAVHTAFLLAVPPRTGRSGSFAGALVVRPS